jgi:chemotaxis protein MotB
MAVLEDNGDDGGGVPEWVVTFGDMMSLLLTFFIMLVSMSEVKEQERYQAMVDSIRQRFGHDMSASGLAPGTMRPRNSSMAHLATLGRARRANTMRGGDKVRAAVGDNPRVRNIRAGRQAAMGATIYFDANAKKLSDENKRQLQITAQVIGGKRQKIEVRGHTSRNQASGDPKETDHWNLAYARCRATMAMLTELGIDPQRFRIAIAADNEPVYSGTDPAKQKKNARVEVTLLNERVQDLDGSAQTEVQSHASPAPQDTDVRATRRNVPALR